MIIKNRLDKPFGPMATSAGIFMLITGVIATYFSLTGLVLVLIGAFIGFTSTSTLLDSLDSAKTVLESLSKQFGLGLR